MAIASINPATGELSKRFEAHSDTEIESALDRAASAFEKHRRTSFASRAAKLQRAAEILEKDREHFARIITSEMGKLFRGSIEEIEKCARGCRYYAEHGEKFLASQSVLLTLREASSAMSQTESFSQSCRGISLSGRSSDLPLRL